MNITTSPADQHGEDTESFSLSRRRFFKLAGGIAGAGVLFSACHPKGSPTNLYLGSGDVALLNFVYVLQQIEAAFYTQAVATPYYGMTHLELIAITDLRDQEIAHREFIKKTLGEKALANITPDFSAVTFADRTSVLTHAAAIEDLAVSGIAGAAIYFTDTSIPSVLAKMLTVEARHSAYARDLLTLNSFSDGVIDANGMDQAQTPGVVLNAALVYSQTRFDASNLPN